MLYVSSMGAWSIVLLDKLVVVHLVRKFLTFVEPGSSQAYN